MRNFYCKYHNRFLDVNYIKTMKKDRCWNCKHFVKIGTSNKKKKWQGR